MNITVFWAVTQCSLAYIYRRLEKLAESYSEIWALVHGNQTAQCQPEQSHRQQYSRLFLFLLLLNDISAINYNNT
jgi:hypothetical protein